MGKQSTLKTKIFHGGSSFDEAVTTAQKIEAENFGLNIEEIEIFLTAKDIKKKIFESFYDGKPIYKIRLKYQEILRFPAGYEDVKSAPEGQDLSVVWGNSEEVEHGVAFRLRDTWFSKSDFGVSRGQICEAPVAWNPIQSIGLE